MADRQVDHLLIGGFAAAQCASTLRKGDADASILLVGREGEPPYERPPLSKEYLRGEAERSARYARPAENTSLGSYRMLSSLSAHATSIKGDSLAFAMLFFEDMP